MKQFDIPEEGLPPVDPSVATDWNPEDKIIIIGAGAAGISAAYTLRYLNVPFVILEASNRHGGRVQRDEEFLGNGVSLDIGAEWIHTTRDTAVLKELLLLEEDRKEIESFIEQETIDFDPQNYTYYNNLWKRSSKFNLLQKFIDKEFKFKTKSWSQYLETYLFSHVKDSIEYEAIVNVIDYSGETTKVILTNGKEYSAAKVICTVPLSILKKDIKFTPGLPKSKQNALNKNKMKPGFKVAIEFKERFYDEVFFDQSFWSSTFWLIFGVGAERTYFDALLNKGIKDKHVMTLYCYGALAEDLSKKDDGELFKAIMKKLDEMYDGKASSNYVKHIVQNWTKEPFIQGVSSDFLYAGLMEKEFGKSPLNDRVFFAGEFVGGKYGPTVHGACLTGRRAAMNTIGQDYNYS